MIDELLNNHKLKKTNCRIDLIHTIKNLGNESTIKNIVNNLEYDKSTIYRNIDTLLKNKIIIKELYNDEVIYRISSNHIHTLKCVSCNTETKIDYCPFNNNVIGNFKVLMHSEIIEGICDKCQKK